MPKSGFRFAHIANGLCKIVGGANSDREIGRVCEPGWHTRGPTGVSAADLDGASYDADLHEHR